MRLPAQLLLLLLAAGCEKATPPPATPIPAPTATPTATPAATPSPPPAQPPVVVADTKPESREEVCCDLEGAGPSWMDPTECHVNNARVLPESRCEQEAPSADMPVELEAPGGP